VKLGEKWGPSGRTIVSVRGGDSLSMGKGVTQARLVRGQQKSPNLTKENKAWVGKRMRDCS